MRMLLSLSWDGGGIFFVRSAVLSENYNVENSLAVPEVANCLNDFRSIKMSCMSLYHVSSMRFGFSPW